MQRSTTVRAALLAGTAVLAAAVPASAVNTVTIGQRPRTGRSTTSRRPKLDTGSIRAISDNAFYGFGGIRVRVSGIPATDHDGAPQRRADARVRAHLRRRRVVRDRQAGACSAGSRISRAVKVSKAGNWTRWLDTFANTTGRDDHGRRRLRRHRGPEHRRPTRAKVVGHVERRHADRRRRHLGRGRQPVHATGVSSRGPSAVVIGSQPGTGNFQRDPFGAPLPVAGLEANFYGYRTRSRSRRARRKSLLRYVVAGRAETTATAGAQVARRSRPARPRSSTTPDLAGHHRRALLHRHQLARSLLDCRDLRRLPRCRRSRRQPAKLDDHDLAATTSSTSRSRRWGRHERPA